MQTMSPSASDPRGNVIVLPLVLTIGCARNFVEHCRFVGATASEKFLVRECDLATAQRAGYRPAIIVVPKRVYDEHAAAFENLATQAAAALLTC